MSEIDSEPSPLEAWPSEPDGNGASANGVAVNGVATNGAAVKGSATKGFATKGSGRNRNANGKRKGRRSRQRTVTTTATPGTSFREYLQYRELFHNLTLRELRSKYKRSVIGWGWSMINPIANMLIYTVVFALLLQIKPPFGVPSGLHNYAIMLLAACCRGTFSRAASWSRWVPCSATKT